MRRRSWSKSFAGFAPVSWMGGRSSSLFFVVLAFLALLFSSLMPGNVSALRTNISGLFVPVLDVLSAPVQEVSAFVGDVSGLAQMQSENIRLKQENARLRSWHQSALLLKNENKSLRHLMNLKLEPAHRYVTARILSDSGNHFVKSLLVSAGLDQGVRAGQAVISGDGVIGRVIEEGRNHARVLLLSDINSRVPVLIEGQNQHAVLAGRNSTLPSLEHLPPDFKVQEGARIVTSGYGGLFPPNLPVGRIIQGAAAGGYRVELFADFTRLTHVRVVRTSSPLSTSLSDSSLSDLSSPRADISRAR